MCFMVGNDFLPHLPNLHINSNALPILYKVYKTVLPKLDGKRAIKSFENEIIFLLFVKIHKNFVLYPSNYSQAT